MTTASRLTPSALLVVLLTAAASACAVAADTSLDASDLMNAPGIDVTALDRTVDPCTDFYRFACGGFLASLGPETMIETRHGSLQTALTALYRQTYRDVLASPATSAEANVAAYVASCENAGDQASTDRFVASMLPEVVAVGTTDELARLLGRLGRSRIAPLFAISLWPRDDRTIQFRMSSSGYDRRTDYGDPVKRAARREVVSALLTKHRIDPTLADDAVEVESRLSRASHVPGTAERLTMKEVGAALSHFPWSSFLASANPRGMPWPTLDVSAPWLAALDGVLATTPLDMLKIAIITQIAALPSAVADEDISSHIAPNERCLAFGEVWPLSKATEKRFYERAGVEAAAREKAHAMFDRLNAAFISRLATNPMLDSATRAEAVDKARQMGRALVHGDGPTFDLAAFDLDRTLPFAANRARLDSASFDYFLTLLGQPLTVAAGIGAAPHEVNASYNSVDNRIELSGATLSGYFFSPAAAPIANFAAVGGIMAHEITHGFDKNGRRYDGEGMERNWWTPSADAAFLDRSQCLVDQYNAFPVPETADPATGAPPRHVDGEFTLNENIADNGGVKLAYEAANVDGGRGRSEAGFGPRERFFIGFAQVYCAKRSRAHAIAQVEHDSHAPPHARVNLSLANFERFAETFHCAEGTPMAPVNRCSVW